MTLGPSYSPKTLLVAYLSLLRLHTLMRPSALLMQYRIPLVKRTFCHCRHVGWGAAGLVTFTPADASLSWLFSLIGRLLWRFLFVSRRRIVCSYMGPLRVPVVCVSGPFCLRKEWSNLSSLFIQIWGFPLFAWSLVVPVDLNRWQSKEVMEGSTQKALATIFEGLQPSIFQWSFHVHWRLSWHHGFQN